MQDGWIPPEHISEEEYKHIRDNKDENIPLTGFVGFGSSFGGKWFGGYARCKTKDRNYTGEAKNSNLKIIENCKDVEFFNLDYRDVPILDGSVVYCDIPYKGTTQYLIKECGKFNHAEFYEWCLENKDKFQIYISEYKDNVPDGFEIVWERESRQDLSNKEGKKSKTVEVLIKPI